MSQCPHCRGSREDCSDPDFVWHRHIEVCHKTVALEASKRLHGEEYKDQPWHDGSFTNWAEKFSPEFAYHYMDGVTIWVADHPQSATDAG